MCLEGCQMQLISGKRQAGRLKEYFCKSDIESVGVKDGGYNG